MVPMTPERPHVAAPDGVGVASGRVQSVDRALRLLGGVAAIFPMALNVLLIGFEFLVAFLQAYVFAILTCIYLHDAVHLH